MLTHRKDNRLSISPLIGSRRAFSKNICKRAGWLLERNAFQIRFVCNFLFVFAGFHLELRDEAII